MASPSAEPSVLGSLVKTTAVDYPGRIAASFFMAGCNLRCPYCQNKELVLGGAEGLCTADDLFRYLEKRRGIIGALVISGGEPLANEAAASLLRRAKSMGLLVKLDTNGTLPDKLAQAVGDEAARPDFIAMDMKTSPDRYGELSPRGGGSIDYTERLRQSIDIISSYPREQREWRTVLVRGLVGVKDIDAMASLLPPDATWQFTQFVPGGCINDDYNRIAPMTDEEAATLVQYAQKTISGARMR